MPNFEEDCKKIFIDPHVMKKMGIGILLALIPILHFFALGYLYRFVERVRLQKQLVLPEWENWGRLFAEGVCFFVIGLLYGVLPIFVTGVLVSILYSLPFGFLRVLSFLLLFLPVLVAPLLTVVAVCRFQLLEDRWRILAEIPVVFKMTKKVLPSCLIPSFTLVGFWVLTFPLIGSTFFLGMILFAGHATKLFILNERQKVQFNS